MASIDEVWFCSRFVPFRQNLCIGFFWVAVSAFMVHSRSESYFLTVGRLMGQKEVSSGALLDDVVVLFFACVGDESQKPGSKVDDGQHTDRRGTFKFCWLWSLLACNEAVFSLLCFSCKQKEKTFQFGGFVDVRQKLLHRSLFETCLLNISWIPTIIGDMPRF